MKDFVGMVVFTMGVGLFSCLPFVLILGAVALFPPNRGAFRAANARATIAAATAAVAGATAESELRALERAAATAAAAVKGGE